MSVSVLMPALSPTMTEGTLARWLVKEGDSVKSGDVIAEIETDKATMEVEALDDGVVAKLAVAEGTQNVAVNAVIAVLAEDGESVDDALAAVAAVPAAAPSTPPQTDAPTAAPAAATSPVQPAVTPVLTARSDRVFASPLAHRIAADAGLELAFVPEQARMAVSSGQMWKKLWLLGRPGLLFSQPRFRGQLLPQSLLKSGLCRITRCGA